MVKVRYVLDSQYNPWVINIDTDPKISASGNGFIDYYHERLLHQVFGQIERRLMTENKVKWKPKHKKASG